ncbi:uncharacterized protein G2W53_027552 [Senna tora]|uniref:Uncharacterized protein n=1 Tax=Senna tora TaxID=362788 RepID=A0A834WGQ3_9FABA|nr:uncharacterized protein G2W53_027552 [Senna tora]
MMPDKSWIDKPIRSSEFLNGVVQFLDFSFSNASVNGKILDTNTEEITTKKMKANEVWHMAKNLKVMVELNVDGHGNDNGTNLLAKISKNLSQDQEHDASFGVPSKIYTDPNDAVKKVFGPKHPGRVLGLGLGACSSKVFGLQRNFVSSAATSSSSANMSGVRMENLVKKIDSLQEKLVG